MQFHKCAAVVLITLLAYLQETKQVDLLHSEYDELASILTDNQHRERSVLKIANEPFESDQARGYFNDFHASTVAAAGNWMAEDFETLRSGLSQLNDTDVIILIAG